MSLNEGKIFSDKGKTSNAEQGNKSTSKKKKEMYNTMNGRHRR